MRKNVLLAIVAIGSLLASGKAYAQDTEIVVQEDVVYGEITDCKDRYYSTSRDNWFIQLVQASMSHTWKISLMTAVRPDATLQQDTLPDSENGSALISAGA